MSASAMQGGHNYKMVILAYLRMYVWVSALLKVTKTPM